MKILFISNIPTPYRNDFYNELGKIVELTVVYEAKTAKNQGIRFNWNDEDIKNYTPYFLSDGDITEKKVDRTIFSFLSREYDYIFVTNYAYYTEMAAIIYLKAHRIPYIMEIDGGVIKKERKLKYILKRFLISGANMYFSPSRDTDQYLKYYGALPEKIRRHPFTSIRENQIQNQKLSQSTKQQIRKELGVSDDKMIVGVGQLIFRKGWDVLLSVATSINAGIYILGDGELRTQYEEIIEDKGLINVHLVGFKSNEDTSKYYKAADVFVLPTRYDIWGLVVNEAMAYGLPVVTTNLCNAGLELIEDGINGYIIDPDDSESLLNSIAMALENSEQLGINALNTIKKYTIENMAKAHLSLLQGDKNA